MVFSKIWENERNILSSIQAQFLFSFLSCFTKVLLGYLSSRFKIVIKWSQLWIKRVKREKHISLTQNINAFVLHTASLDYLSVNSREIWIPMSRSIKLSFSSRSQIKNKEKNWGILGNDTNTYEFKNYLCISKSLKLHFISRGTEDCMNKRIRTQPDKARLIFNC